MASRILFVDDDATTRLATVELLARAGYKAIGVGSLPEAQEALREFAPDLLITDIRLGEHNGLQLVVMEGPIRAVVVTGYSDPVLEAEAREHGATVLIKPVDPSTLLATVKEMLVRPTPSPKRRWERKRITRAFSADVNGAAARVVDISYGGVRVELEQMPMRTTADALTMAIGHLAVPVDLVWHVPAGDQRWTCGLAVLPADPDVASNWFELVDSAV